MRGDLQQQKHKQKMANQALLATKNCRSKEGNWGRSPVRAYARDEDRARALKAGFDRHLAKPVPPDVLVEAIVSLRRQAIAT